MAHTASSMSALGSAAPDFSLHDVVTDTVTTRRDATGPKGMLVMFICRHCPFVKHVQAELAAIGRDYVARGVGVVAISANDPAAYPDDGPQSLAEMARDVGFNFPYLYDDTQAVAKAYDAQCTPDFFLYDADGRLAYRGQLDGSRPGNGVPVTGQDLRAALDAVVAGRPAVRDQRPSIGCSIKWK